MYIYIAADGDHPQKLPSLYRYSTYNEVGWYKSFTKRNWCTGSYVQYMYKWIR